MTLKGEKSYEKEEKDKNYHVSERAYGSFPALLRAARRRRPRQDRRRSDERRADHHPAEDSGSAEAAEEDRGQGGCLSRSRLDGGGLSRPSRADSERISSRRTND